ncbi:alpha/beta hydrolase [Novosphingobium sp. AAP83]|uniref:alpha/beta fold hydrolase n=1 Tax=Novosphingobium sp. AAP83 TaxID=1523425 RepID=UPI0006B9D591|nr:alpha/beta hydrolase [Novosphingobium sp. AAP83]KPF90758.1 alpha/beta hydrolase [Novosphingobium sp. AAP83]
MTIFKESGTLLLGISFLAAAISASAQTPLAPTFPSDAQMRAQYALPQSQFAMIEGENVHYVDEGTGPAILLLHGSYASLRQWDDWARELVKHYRVIRFDQSPAGLSGPNPVQDYSLDHRLAVIDGLMNKLKVDRFIIVGTSSAGVPTTAYAATRPTRITGMVLNNIAIAQFPMDLAKMPKGLQAAVAEDRTHPGFHRPDFWRQILLANIEDKARITPSLVQQWTELNHRALRDPKVGKAVYAQMTPFSRSGEDLPKINAPTLILWGQSDHETPVNTHGIPAFVASGAVDKTLELIPNCGHMVPLDCPARAMERMMPFLKRITG